jgi:hypothetical protein
MSVGLALPPAARADDVIAAAPLARALSAYGGAAAWLYDSSGGSRVAYTHRGVVRQLPHNTFAMPSLPDLGPSRDGRDVVLVVTRCRATRCRVETLNLDSGRISPVHGFAHVRNGEDRLYYRGRSGPARRLRAISSGDSGQTDLDGRRVAVLEDRANRLDLVSVRTGRRRVVAQGDENLQFRWGPQSPSLDHGALYWEQASATNPDVRSLVRTVAAFAPSRFCAVPLASTTGAVVVDRGRVLYLTPPSPISALMLRDAGVTDLTHCATTLAPVVNVR